MSSDAVAYICIAVVVCTLIVCSTIESVWGGGDDE